MDLSTFLVITLLIFINALYVAAEFAAVSVRRSRIQERAERGHPLATRMINILNQPLLLDKYVAACQIGITFSSLVLGAYGQAKLGFALAPVFESWGGLQFSAAQSASAALILIGLTALQMILGELVPKSLALEYPVRIALWTLLPMEWSLRLYSGFIKVLNGSGHLVLGLFGIKTAQQSHHVHSPEEIKLLVEESRDQGLLGADEHQRLHRALDIGVRPVSDIMIPKAKIQALDVNSPLKKVIRTFAEKPFTRLPIYEKNLDNIIGLVHARDVTLAALRSKEKFSLREILQPILAVSKETTAEELLIKMREAKRQIATVVDRSGHTIGLVGVADVLGEFLGDVVEQSPTSSTPSERKAAATTSTSVRLQIERLRQRSMGALGVGASSNQKPGPMRH